MAVAVEWEAEQRAMSLAVVEEDAWDIEQTRYIGGVDLSFVKGNDNVACAALVVLEYPR